MTRLKDETLCIRTSAEIKRLLRLAAERERRSAASMIEVLVLEYARAHELKLDIEADETVEATSGRAVTKVAARPLTQPATEGRSD